MPIAARVLAKALRFGANPASDDVMSAQATPPPAPATSRHIERKNRRGAGRRERIGQADFQGWKGRAAIVPDVMAASSGDMGFPQRCPTIGIEGHAPSGATSRASDIRTRRVARRASIAKNEGVQALTTTVRTESRSRSDWRRGSLRQRPAFHRCRRHSTSTARRPSACSPPSWTRRGWCPDRPGT